MKVVVKLFASYREKAGTPQVELDLPEGTTTGRLVQEVVGRYPSITADPTKLVVAVNDEFHDHGYVLSDGDEAALIPPVSGGAA